MDKIRVILLLSWYFRNNFLETLFHCLFMLTQKLRNQVTHRERISVLALLTFYFTQPQRIKKANNCKKSCAQENFHRLKAKLLAQEQEMVSKTVQDNTNIILAIFWRISFGLATIYVLRLLSHCWSNCHFYDLKSKGLISN